MGIGPTMMEDILGSKVKVRILRLMMVRDRDLTLQEIVRILGLSTGCAHPAIKELERKRIVLGTKIGRSTLYSINKSNILYAEIKGLFTREGTAYRDIAKEYAEMIEKSNIVNIILFGSVARGDSLDPGDIDMLEITKDGVEKDVDKAIAKELEEKYDVHISTLRISRNDALKKVRSYDNFIINVLDEGIVLHGDDRWLRK